MSTVTVSINTDNAAFSEGGAMAGAAEVARLLRDSAAEVEALGLRTDSAPLRDYNGNTVGEWRITND